MLPGAAYWKLLGAALLLRVAAAFVVPAGADGSAGEALSGTDSAVARWIFRLFVLFVLALWATKAPRGAAGVLSCLCILDAVALVQVAVGGEPWALVPAGLMVAAAWCAERAIRPADAYLAEAKRREEAARAWEEQQTWTQRSW